MIRNLIAICVSVLAFTLPGHAAFEPAQVIPADNSEVASLSKITVKWPGEWFEGISYDICGKVVDASGQKVADITCEENFSYANAACDLILSEKITEPGTYTVYVDADAVQSEDEEWNQPFQLKYTVVDASLQSIKLESANPQNNSTVASLRTIKTFWSDRIKTINQDIKCEVLDSDGNKVSDVKVEKGVFSTDPITFTLSQEVVNDGTFKVVIPAGLLLTEDGIKSEAVTLIYTVDSSTAVTLTPLSINPENNSIIENLDEFSIVWDTEFDFDYEATGVGKVTDELGFTVATINCMADFMDADILVFVLSESLEEAGEYTVVIEAGAITDSNGAKNSEITLTYTINPNLTGIDNIEAASKCNVSVTGKCLNVEGYDAVTVVDLSGKTIAKSNGELSITLDSGIYIIDCSGEHGSKKYKVVI